MKTWKLILGVVLVFILGVLTGLLPGFYYRHGFPPPPSAMDHNARDAFVLKKLTQDLALTEGQIPKVRGIVEQTGVRLDRHFKLVEPELQRIFDDSFSQMELVLNDGQKERLRRMKERMEQEKRMRLPRP